MMKIRLALFAFLATALVPMAVLASPRDDYKACTDDAKGDIAACARAIASKAFSGDELAKLYEHRAYLYQDKRDFAKALPDFDAAIQLHPYPGLLVNRIPILGVVDGNAKAVAEANRLLGRNDFDHDWDPLVYYARGYAYYELRQLDRAVADFTTSVKLQPDQSDAYLMRCATRVELHQPLEAIKDCDLSLKNGFDPMAYEFRCTAYADAGQRSKAIANCNEALRLEPDKAGHWNARCFVRGINGGDFDNAITDCNKALSLQPKDGNTLDTRGFVYLKAGNLDKAIADYDAALAIDPKLGTSLYGRGVAKLKKGDNTGSADIAAAKRIKNDVAEDFARYGVKQPALQAASAPATPALASAAAYVERCQARVGTGQISLAIADCDEAAHLEPGNADYLNAACFVRAIGGRDLDKAIDDCNKSLSLKPSDSAALDSRGFAHLKAGHLDKAIADYDAALARDPKFAPSLYGRGVAKLKKGDSSGSADIADAKAIERNITKQFAGYGIEQMQAARVPAMPAPASLPAGNSRPAAAKSDPCALAATHWQSAESIHTLAAYRDHLARFPTCTFADLARARIAAFTEPEPARSRAVKKKGPKTAHARARLAPATSGQLNCSNPAQWAACASGFLGTVPGSN